MNPGTLMKVVNDRQVEIRPANHGQCEIVNVGELRLWLKGNHRLGEHAMKRVMEIEKIAEIRDRLNKKGALRKVSLNEVQAWIENGTNPVVICRLGKERTPSPARLIGMRGDQVLCTPLGTNLPPQELELENVRIPDGIDLSQEEHSMLAKAIAMVQGDLVPDKRDSAIKAARTELPQARPEAPKPPVVAAAPPPIQMPLPEPPREPRPVGQGEWVIVDRKRRVFWAKNERMAYGEWGKSLDEARVYENAGGVNVAVARMLRNPGDDPEPMSRRQAKFFFDMWYGKRTTAESGIVAPKPEAREPEVLKPEPPAVGTRTFNRELESPNLPQVPSVPPPHIPTIMPAQSDAMAKLAQAIRERAAADAMAMEARAKEAIARAEFEIAQLAR